MALGSLAGLPSVARWAIDPGAGWQKVLCGARDNPDSLASMGAPRRLRTATGVCSKCRANCAAMR